MKRADDGETHTVSSEKREILPEPPIYEPADVVERSALGFRTSRKMFDNVKRRKELSSCGFRSSKQAPYKPFGNLELDPNKLSLHKTGPADPDIKERAYLNNSSSPEQATQEILPPQPAPQPEHVENIVMHIPTEPSTSSIPSGYSFIRNRLVQANERLKVVKAGTQLLETVPSARFIDEIKKIGTSSQAPKQDNAEPPTKPSDTMSKPSDLFITSTNYSLPVSQNDENPMTPLSVRAHNVPSLSLKSLDSGTLKKHTSNNELPPVTPGGFHTQAQTDRPKKSEPIVQESVKDNRKDVHPSSARFSKHETGSVCESSNSAELFGSLKNTPLDAEFSISQTRMDFYQTKRMLTQRLHSDIVRHDQDMLMTIKTKFSVLDQSQSCGVLDAAGELETMRLKAKKERFIRHIKSHSKNPWFVNLLSNLSEKGKKVTPEEEYLFKLLKRIVEQDEVLTRVIFYGMVKLIPTEYHSSTELQNMITYLRQDVLGISAMDYRAWLVHNCLPIPDSLPAPLWKGARAKLLSRRNSFMADKASPRNVGFAVSNGSSPETPPPSEK